VAKSKTQQLLGGKITLSQPEPGQTPITTDPASSGGSHQTEMDKCSALQRNYHFDASIPEINHELFIQQLTKGTTC